MPVLEEEPAVCIGRGIRTVHYLVYLDAQRQYRWTLFAANNRKIANSGEGYHNREDCVAAINLVASTGPSAVQLVISYSPETIRYHALSAEGAVPRIEKALKLEELRGARFQRNLLPHRKAQPRRNKGAKP